MTPEALSTPVESSLTKGLNMYVKGVPVGDRYSDVFRTMRAKTRDLRDTPGLLELLKAKGYCWIRRCNYRYNQILRLPTDGCIVDLFVHQHPGCMHIDSPAAKKLLKRMNYF